MKSEKETNTGLQYQLFQDEQFYINKAIND